MTMQRVRKNLYRGSMDRDQAMEKLRRAAQRIGATELKVTAGGPQGSARVAFAIRGGRIERTCATQPTYDANLACLALWLEDRARNIERGIESFSEAFADSMTLAIVGGDPRQIEGKRKGVYRGRRSLDQCIEMFRSSLARLGISERDVKLTWNETENWARFRMRLPSGNIVDKVSRLQPTYLANVAALGLWLQSRTKNWERGIEDFDLDRVFAGNLLPSRTTT